jgi:lipopolysaccharide/colanic/teichoic acid biosynthesis glycosyltransferase
MLKLKSKQFAAFIGDGAVAIISLFSALTLRFLDVPTWERVSIHANIFIPLFIILVILYYSFDFYDFSPFQTSLRQFARVINIHIFIALIGFAYFYMFASYTGITPKTVLIFYTAFHIVFAVLWRIFIMPHILRPQDRQKTLLIAEGEDYQELKEMVNNHQFSPFYFVEHISVFSEDITNSPNSLEGLKKILDENDITQVVVDIRDERTAPILSFLYTLASQRKIHVFDAAMVYQDTLKKMPMRGVGHFWFFESVHMNIRTYEATKRVIDVIIAFPILLAYCFVLPFIYIAIKLDDGGKLFSIQRRYGRGGKILNIYKIRTMQFTDDGDWVLQNKTNKITKVGNFLRKTRLDEFPQLFNVLKGDVSLVGPRPDILANGGKLSAQIPFYMMRYTVTPGLSGWAQVSQYFPPNSVEETKVRLQYDLYYVKNRSLLLDLIIMIKTFRVLVLRTGI